MVEPTPLRPASLHEEVATRLRQMIFDRVLQPGQWIDELALAGDWQISRTPLREALKVLAAEGLVTPVPRQGCKVAEMSEEDADELLPVMALLEGRCAYEAVRSCPKPVIAMIHGFCMGGGVGLAVAADLRISADDANFGVPAAKLGLGYPPRGMATLLALGYGPNAVGALFLR